MRSAICQDIVHIKLRERWVSSVDILYILVPAIPVSPSLPKIQKQAARGLAHEHISAKNRWRNVADTKSKDSVQPVHPTTIQLVDSHDRLLLQIKNMQIRLYNCITWSGFSLFAMSIAPFPMHDPDTTKIPKVACALTHFQIPTKVDLCKQKFSSLEVRKITHILTFV